MADSSTVNSQITDAIAAINVEVISLSPAVATANLYQATAQALSNAAHNGTQSQQTGHTILAAVGAAGSTMIMATAK